MLCCSSAPNVKQRKALSSKMAAACKVGDSKEVKRRLELGEKPNAPPAIVGGMTALMIAVFNGHEKVVKVLEAILTAARKTVFVDAAWAERTAARASSLPKKRSHSPADLTILLRSW